MGAFRYCRYGLDKKNTEVTPEGATGYGVKLLNRLLREYYEK